MRRPWSKTNSSQLIRNVRWEARGEKRLDSVLKFKPKNTWISMKALVVFVAVYLALSLLCGAELTSWPFPPPSNDTEPGGTLDYGWAIEDKIDHGHCEDEPQGFNITSNSGQQHFAAVSYYIAQGYAVPLRIHAPVPCLSRILVRSAKTGVSIVARITHICTHCRNKHIRLSPAAFAKLVPSKRPGSNSSAAEVKIWWSIHILRSADEGNRLPTLNGTEDINQIRRDLRADIEAGREMREKLNNSLQLNEECDQNDDIWGKILMSGNLEVQFLQFKDPDLFDDMLKRYEYDRANRIPGKFCDFISKNLICSNRKKCQCFPSHLPLDPLPGCLNRNDDFVCMLHSEDRPGKLFESAWPGKCPPHLNLCQLKREGDARCIPQFRKRIGQQFDTLNDFSRFSVTDDNTGPQNCLCINTTVFENFFKTTYELVSALEALAPLNRLEFNASCDSNAEEIKHSIWHRLRALDGPLQPVSSRSNQLFLQIWARADLAGSMRLLKNGKLPLCKPYERLACNSESRRCECYSSLSEHVELVRDDARSACVLKKNSICDPAFWDGRFENYIDAYEEDAPRPLCEGGLPCVDMRTGQLCPRNESFVTVSFKYKLFPLLHSRLNDQEASKLRLEDYCRCHEIFSVEGSRKIWMPALAGCLGALALVFIVTVVMYWRRLRQAETEELEMEEMTMEMKEMEVYAFLRGYIYWPSSQVRRLWENDWSDEIWDGAVRAQLLPYDHQKYEIDPNDVEYGEEDDRLGYGGFGVVVCGTLWKDGMGREVAIKSCKHASDRDEIRSIRIEIKIFSYVGQHPNVVEFIGAIAAHTETPKLILELCKRGSLDKLLRKNPERFLDQRVGGKFDPTFQGKVIPGYDPNWIISTTNLLCWAYQIANGMEYLGSKAVIHGDLFLKNVLIDSNGVAKVTDFGLAHQFGFNGKRYIRAHGGYVPLPQFLPPEARNEPRKLSPAFDVWTFGILLWEMFSLGKEPKCRRSAEELKQPAYGTEVLHATSRCCWITDLAQRIGFKELKEKLHIEIGGEVDPAAGVVLPIHRELSLTTQEFTYPYNDLSVPSKPRVCTMQHTQYVVCNQHEMQEMSVGSSLK